MVVSAIVSTPQDAKYGKWRARINASGKCINLGYHDTAELAAAAFEAARMKYHTV
nr:AP2 domain-containing protein [Escherichia coli]